MIFIFAIVRQGKYDRILYEMSKIQIEFLDSLVQVYFQLNNHINFNSVLST